MIYVPRSIRHALVIGTLSLSLAAPAIARPPMRDDPGVVAHKLNEMGFKSWRKLTWHHGFWKVKDARRDNGKTYDLKLKAGSLDVVKLRRDRR